MSVGDERDSMHRRRITLADGRYLIFYTFDEGDAPHASDTQEEEEAAAAGQRRRPEPDAVAPEAEEERSV